MSTQEDKKIIEWLEYKWVKSVLIVSPSACLHRDDITLY